MSIQKFALTAIATAVLLTPALTTAEAKNVAKAKPTASSYADRDRYDSYDRYVAARHKARHGIRPETNIRTPGIDRRIARQYARIRAGRYDGELTWREARRLKKGVRQVRRELRRAARDGNVTRYERQDIHAMLNDNSRRIVKLIRNDRRAGRYSRKFSRYIDF